jgi:adenylosuccinate synthase
MDRIPVCVAYDVDGDITEDFPTGDRLMRAKPIYRYLEGFRSDLSACRRSEDLPAAARAYIDFLEQSVGSPIQYVCVGAERDAYIRMH